MNTFEIQQISIYCDTVYMIMKNHKDLSLIKVALFAYILNKSRYYDHEIYNARQRVDLVNKAVSVLNGDFDGFVKILPYILKAIDILNRTGAIMVTDGFVHLGDKNLNAVNCNGESAFSQKAIEASKNWSDIRFIKEVLHNV